MKHKKLLTALASLVVIGGVAGLVVSCDDSSESGGTNVETPVTDTNVQVQSFSLDTSVENDSLSIGESIHVVPTIESPSDATDGDFTFSSSDDSIATVDEDTGKVTGVSAGEVTITVTCENFDEEDGEEDGATKSIDLTVTGDASIASGAYIYSGGDYETKLDILGKLEEYAMDNSMTGITLYNNGGYVMYSDRVEKGTNNYISGYGFGVGAEGRLTSANTLYSDEGTEWYYHTYAGTQNNYNFNYLDDTGSESSTLYGYVAGTYYGTKMNDTGDGYEWYPSLANTYDSEKEAEYASKVDGGSDNTVSAILEENESEYTVNDLTSTQLNRPIALNKDPVTGLATQYRIYLKTGYDYSNGTEDHSQVGGDELVYHTSENSPYHDEFDGRPVSIMDYVYPYMLLLNGSIGLARSSDMYSSSYDGTLRGGLTYYNATSSGVSDSDYSEADILDDLDFFCSTVGIDIGLDDDPTTPDAPCITVTLNNGLSEFDAMYALSSTLVSPIPIEFIETIGAAHTGETFDESTQDSLDSNARGKYIYNGIQNAYGITDSDAGTDPSDNLLSVGPYILDTCEQYLIEYSRNDDYIGKFEQGRYDESIEGIALHYYSEGNDTAFQEFLTGYLDAASIPQDYIDEYKDDTRTTITDGDTTFKLNVNACNQDEWNDIFGADGENESANHIDDYYECNPFMSNDKFIQALSYGIDRETYATNRGYVASQDYFADVYLWDPENGLSYNDTPQHQGNLAERSPETYGYNFDVAVTLMDQAIDEVCKEYGLEESVDYTSGTYGGGSADDRWSESSHTGNNIGIINISWMNPTDPDNYGDEVIEYWNQVLEATDAYRNGFRIAFTQEAGSTDYQEVYDKMSEGTFDLAFGSVSGMEYDPLGFLQVFKSNNESGFTLSYAGPTDVIDEEEGKVVYYDGKKWSFDGLWDAGNQGVVLSDSGEIITEPVETEQSSVTTETHNGEEAVKILFNYTINTQAAAVTFNLSAYDDDIVSVNAKNGNATVAFSLDAGTYVEVNGNATSVDENLSLTTEAATTDPETGAITGTIAVFIPSILPPTLTGQNIMLNAEDLSDVSFNFTLYEVFTDGSTGNNVTVTDTLVLTMTTSISDGLAD